MEEKETPPLWMSILFWMWALFVFISYVLLFILPELGKGT